MRFIFLATSLICFANAKLKPVLRHNKAVMDEYGKTATVEECEQTFNALDQDNSGIISLGDVEFISQNLSQEKTAELTDALSQMLHATGITSIQDDFSLSHADYMYFCMNADNLEAATAKRVEWKNKADGGKQGEMNAHKQMRAELRKHIATQEEPECLTYCDEGLYCGSGQCQSNGSCTTLEDCFNPFNRFNRTSCPGTMECTNSGECIMNCEAEPSEPSCTHECGRGEFCGWEGCQPNGSCESPEDCFLGDNFFPMPMILCDGSVYCTEGRCNFQCAHWLSNP